MVFGKPLSLYSPLTSVLQILRTVRRFEPLVARIARMGIEELDSLDSLDAWLTSHSYRHRGYSRLISLAHLGLLVPLRDMLNLLVNLRKSR
jgi:hypothetical protein